jgi:hypothetical protein
VLSGPDSSAQGGGAVGSQDVNPDTNVAAVAADTGGQTYSVTPNVYEAPPNTSGSANSGGLQFAGWSYQNGSLYEIYQGDDGKFYTYPFSGPLPEGFLQQTPPAPPAPSQPQGSILNNAMQEAVGPYDPTALAVGPYDPTVANISDVLAGSDWASLLNNSVTPVSNISDVLAGSDWASLLNPQNSSPTTGAPPATSTTSGFSIPPPAAVSPPGTYDIPPGVLWTQYTGALRDAADPNNPALARGILYGLAAAASLVASAEELFRGAINTVSNMGIGGGEHVGRASLWMDQGEYAEAAGEVFFSIASEATAFNSAAGIAAPYRAVAPRLPPAIKLPPDFLLEEASPLGPEHPSALAPDNPQLYGPYSHQINKGGLDKIIATDKLLSTEASYVAGGKVGVRAVPGPGGFSNTRDVIEFMTYEKPTLRMGIDNSVRPPAYVPYQADWNIPEGDYLGIRLQRVFNVDGTIDIFNFD